VVDVLLTYLMEGQPLDLKIAPIRGEYAPSPTAAVCQRTIDGRREDNTDRRVNVADA
jgi:hypothetical protein